MKIHVSITTYNRIEQCISTLKMVEREFKDFEYSVSVIDDCTNSAKPLEIYCVMHGITYHRNAVNNGKKRHWVNANHVFHYARLEEADYLVWLADDMEYEEGWFVNCMNEMKAGQFLVMNCFLDHRAYCSNWHRHPKKTKEGYFKDGIFDGCGILSKKALERINYFVPPIHPKRWERNPLLSSGVGKWLTVNLDRIGIVSSQYITHDWDASKSKMNGTDRAEHRKNRNEKK